MTGHKIEIGCFPPELREHLPGFPGIMIKGYFKMTESAVYSWKRPVYLNTQATEQKFNEFFHIFLVS